MDRLAQTVARLANAVDTNGARLTAKEKGNAEVTRGGAPMQLRCCCKPLN